MTDPPRIVTEIAQAEPWREGNSEELTCDSVGKPKPTVTWKKDGNILTQGRRIAKLEFSPVTYKDEGLYTCIAENVGGQEEKQVQINVHCRCIKICLNLILLSQLVFRKFCTKLQNSVM